MDRKPVVVVVVAAVALANAGCGGSSKPLSRAELVKHVNAICKPREARIQATLRRTKSIPAAERELLPTMEKSIDDLAGLKAPARLQARYARFVADERIHVVGIRRTLAGKPNKPGTEHGHERYRLVTELGFTECH
jgi:hypothetical protein